MDTWAIHIGGLVQGVGFRPYVCRLAEEMQLFGWVSNTPDGVHIEINAEEDIADEFYRRVISNPPANAIITTHHLGQVTSSYFNSFDIRESNNNVPPNLLLTPDVAICPSCVKEMNDKLNRRFGYPFITCLNCGPRYSIIEDLPYERHHTTMRQLPMCEACSKEYNDIHNRRHYSQTNSCPTCTIPIHLYNSEGNEITNDYHEAIKIIGKAFKEGMVAAVKGVGGYLLMCDATQAAPIITLRQRKRRPAKPFALLYSSIEAAEKDVAITAEEKQQLQSKVAPIVLCKVKQQTSNNICTNFIAPGLNRIGVMLPYTGLLALLAAGSNKPLIATSGNISGSPIIHDDGDALEYLKSFADYILTFDRDIVTPQDDSVIQFTLEAQQKIILRRSRGLAPNYYPNPFDTKECILATGGELKSAFALVDKGNLYVSQFLGDQGEFEAQQAYYKTVDHLLQLIKANPKHILVDKHPNYSVATFGRQLADRLNIPLHEVQHHKAHFAAVLAENNLLQSSEPVLGIVWDGTGFGDDKQVWGGEFFIFEDLLIDRIAHFEYFPQLLGDKMSKEPRLSALSLLRHNRQQFQAIQNYFSKEESDFLFKLIEQPKHLLTSSVGRMLDGISSILNIQHYNSYEGEAAMKLEATALRSTDKSLDFYPIPLLKNRVDWHMMIDELIIDKNANIATERIAFKVFASLAKCIMNTALHFGVKRVAFSGGVFQNALLVDLVIALMKDDFQLYFHQQLSPNDECIGFGQLAYYSLSQPSEKTISVETISLQL